MKQSLLVAMGLVGMGLGMVGCNTDLETGYKPRLLNVDDSERNAYYATPYSPAQMQAQMSDRAATEARRPTPNIR